MPTKEQSSDPMMNRIYDLRARLKNKKHNQQPLTIAKAHSGLSYLTYRKWMDADHKMSDKKKDKFFAEAKENALEVIKLTAKIQKKNRFKGYTNEEKIEWLEMTRKAHCLLGRHYFHHFLLAIEWKRPLQKQFYRPRIKQLRPLVDDIQRLWERELKLLAISMPAGTGKSTLGIFAMAWIIGMDWEKPNLMTGYGSQLTSSFYMGVKAIIEDPEYGYATVFPDTKMVRSDAKDGILDYRGDGRKNPRRIPTLQCISIEGAVTGRGRCENMLYSDDLVNGIEEGLNRDRLETKWLKYANDFRSRAKNNYIELIIGTRWSLHDPIGKLRSLYDDDDRYKFVEMPALNDDDESNFDYKYDVGFSTQYFRDQRDIMDEISFQCQYQQQPVERDGLAFQEDELRRYFTLPQDPPDEIMAWCDVAFGGGDFLSFPIVYWWGDDGYVVDVVFDRNDYTVTEPKVFAKILQHSIQRATFEANNGGDFYARDIIDMMKDESHKCNITWQRASNQKSKLARIIQYKPDIANLIFKDKTLYKPKSEYGKFMQNLTTFVENGNSKHDDAPDSLAGLSSMLRKVVRAKVKIVERRGTGL